MNDMKEFLKGWDGKETIKSLRSHACLLLFQSQSLELLQGEILYEPLDNFELADVTLAEKDLLLLHNNEKKELTIQSRRIPSTLFFPSSNDIDNSLGFMFPRRALQKLA